MKNIITVTATQARQQFFELIDAAYYEDTEVHITKGAKIVVKLMADDSLTNIKKKIEDIQKNFKPFLTDADVTEYKKQHKKLQKNRFPSW